MKKIIVIIFILLFSGSLSAKVSLPSIFSDGMVLQQETEINIWGRADKRVSINTSWNGKIYNVTTDNNGNWKIKIKTPSAGGPYTITFNDGQDLKLADILIGEVWLASGQSNMEMPLRGWKTELISNSEEAIRTSENSKIRFFKVENVSWKKPLDDCGGYWQNATPQTSPLFSAVDYFYARELYKKLNVPVGIIQSDWGGTIIQAWMGKEVLSTFPDAKIPEEEDEKNVNQNIHSGLYNGMIHPLLGYGIKGAIWYQGESNRTQPDLYLEMFPAMVKHWREKWGIGDFPFYYAQLAPFLSKDALSSESIIKMNLLVARMREVQQLSEKKIKNSGMAVLLDVGAENTIHPPDKKTVAERLLYHALAKTYGQKDIAYSGPVYTGKQIKGNTIILSFKYTYGGLLLKTEQPENFEIAGADKKFYPSKVRIEGDKIILTSDKVQKPVEARYAFKAWVKGNLYNKKELPASSFRTDNWEIK